ncbi:DegV family protein [uncultured Parolsenella sp.]|uniref:DegV family protein n=1 Tax=uncultured Parolsenella sp. TaxID=2083008 RepID=UPI0027D9C23E|nr:DegV family protein [uncultured Parolsenella sp.]
MSKFTLTCCSTADRPKSFFDGRGIPYACFHWNEGGHDHLDDLYQSISPDEFYAEIKAGAMPTTSQVSAGEYVEFWEPFVAAGSDVLHVSLSSGLSGSYNSAVMAAEQVMANHPGRRVLVVDSLGASSGYGMLVEYLADLRDEGASLDEANEWAMAHRLNVHHWFFSTDLSSYVRGGRVSRVSGFVGTALRICPVLKMNDEGKLIPRDKIRTKRKAELDMLERMKQHAEGGLSYSGKCSISMSACREDAAAVRDLVEDAFPALAGKVTINDIGTVIGSHTGPGTVALFFMGDTRGR